MAFKRADKQNERIYHVRFIASSRYQFSFVRAAFNRKHPRYLD